MKQGDRIVRSLFVALAVGLGWGIRGDFGHLLGAMFPGAALGLGFAYVSGQKSMFRWAPVLGAIGALGISTGGAMSYGILHGYAKSDTFINYSYGFFTLILQGGAWGCFGCALLGLALEKEPFKALELVSMTVTVFLSGWFVYFLVVNLIGFHINPDRSDLSIGFTGGVIGLFFWLIWTKHGLGWRGAFLGYVGFGMGMALGRLFANASYLQPFPVNHWNIMEVSCGLIGGFVFAYGMLGRKYPDPPEDRGFRLLSAYSLIYVMAFIPLLHHLRRIDPDEKLAQWSLSLQSYGYANPDSMSHIVLWLIRIVCVLGFAGAVVWLIMYLRNRECWSAFPILFFSLVMLLIQNLNALYFFYPRQAGSINMHFVFWVIYGLMLLYAIFWNQREIPELPEEERPLAWKKWVIGCVVIYVLILVLSGFINGQETMASANTRFPLWSWRDGVK